mgnify:CR=1 FL=1
MKYSHLALLAFLAAGLPCGSVVAENAVAQAAVQQSEVTVKGRIVDQNGQPIPGAAVYVKGTTNGTVSDMDGNFTLKVAPDAVLQTSFVGYSSSEVPVDGKTDLGDIALQDDSQELEQVVVVGYGTQKKVDLTGSVAVVDAEQMKKVSNSNISTMLEGKVPGVSVTSDGQPGADPSVRIRGVGSFGDTSPLYVIDGVPMGTTIRDFSPNDIETIQILKDASAAAIYGSRAANGVVIITTKSGKKEQPMRIDYSGYVGMDRVPEGVYEVMNAEEYINHIRRACANSGTTLPAGYVEGSTEYEKYIKGVDTDWFDEVFKTGIRQNHNVNISGGGTSSTYNIGLDYYQQKGTIEGAGPNYDRFTARVNNTMDVKFIKFKTGIVYSHSSQDNMATSNANEYVQGIYGTNNPVLLDALIMAPTIKAYDESTWCLDEMYPGAANYSYDAYGYGTYYDKVHGDISQINPLLKNNRLIRNTTVDRVVATATADVDLFDMFNHKNENHSLTYRINLSWSKTFCRDNTFLGAFYVSNRNYLDKDNERLIEGYRQNTGGLVENTLQYNGTIGVNHINVVVGQTYEHEKYHTLTGTGINYPEPYYLQVANGLTRDAYSYASEHVLTSYLGRLNYDFDERYLLSATVRRDGSSRLSPDDRWGTFPSFSVGWRIDKEAFFDNVDKSLINLLKVRGSYGVLGNENIGEYRYLTSMARNNMTYSFGGETITGSAPSTFVYDKIQWEKKKSFNIGLDLGMLNNKLEFSAEYYKNTSEDLLYDVSMPTNAGVSNSTVTMNAASMENSGLEFSVNYHNYDRPVKYEVSFNLSTLKNKVTSLGIASDYYLTGDYYTKVGDEIGQFYGYVYDGIFQTQEEVDAYVNEKGEALQNGVKVGECRYKDINGDGIVNENDRTILGSGMPKVNFGLGARVEWKGWDLSVATFGALKYKVTDHIWNVLHSSYGAGNKSTDLIDSWTAENPGSEPRVGWDAGTGWNDVFSERKIQDAAYWKIANVELGYNFPDEWFADRISSVRVYVSGQNLATLTKYEGYNVDYAGGTFTPGLNYCSYPTPRTFMAGLKFSF